MDARAFRRFRKNKGAIVGAVLVTLVTLTAFLGPLAAPHDPDRQYNAALDQETGLPVPPNAEFRLGADQLGRDELSRLLHGGRVSMQVAFGATALAILVGLGVGVTTGYFGGFFDTAAMRLVDVLLSMPFLLVVIVVNQVFDSPSLAVLYVLLGLLSWTTLARVTRAKTMQVRELEFIQAARAIGMSRRRIIFKHLLPNVIQPAIILGSTLIAQIIIVESAMSFLGLGVRPPTSSWGSMLHDGVGFISNAPRLVIFPGTLIVAAVFGFNLLGEGLRDALDPKS